MTYLFYNWKLVPLNLLYLFFPSSHPHQTLGDLLMHRIFIIPWESDNHLGQARLRKRDFHKSVLSTNITIYYEVLFCKFCCLPPMTLWISVSTYGSLKTLLRWDILLPQTYLLAHRVFNFGLSFWILGFLWHWRSNRNSWNVAFIQHLFQTSRIINHTAKIGQYLFYT